MSEGQNVLGAKCHEASCHETTRPWGELSVSNFFTFCSF
jgi:hypothetical protein